MPESSAARIVPVSLLTQSRQSVVATAAYIESRRLTPSATRIGNIVTMSSMARPEALLMASPKSIPSAQQAISDEVIGGLDANSG